MIDILIIEDHPDISGPLHDFLCREGFRCQTVHNGEDGLQFLEENTVRMVLLDIMLPGLDGLSVCQTIHKEKNLPLIILSAKAEKRDKLSGLDLGADDYIEKPFDIDLLLAKVRALYRRHYDTAAAQKTVAAGPVYIDKIARTAVLNGSPLNLTIKEYDLLLLLAENQGKALRKEYIFDQVWGSGSFSEPSTLTVHIKWLREKIEKAPKAPRHIITIWGVGYKFEE